MSNTRCTLHYTKTKFHTSTNTRFLSLCNTKDHSVLKFILKVFLALVSHCIHSQTTETTEMHANINIFACCTDSCKVIFCMSIHLLHCLMCVSAVSYAIMKMFFEMKWKNCSVIITILIGISQIKLDGLMHTSS